MCLSHWPGRCPVREASSDGSSTLTWPLSCERGFQRREFHIDLAVVLWERLPATGVPHWPGRCPVREASSDGSSTLTWPLSCEGGFQRREFHIDLAVVLWGRLPVTGVQPDWTIPVALPSPVVLALVARAAIRFDNRNVAFLSRATCSTEDGSTGADEVAGERPSLRDRSFRPTSGSRGGYTWGRRHRKLDRRRSRAASISSPTPMPALSRSSSPSSPVLQIVSPPPPTIWGWHLPCLSYMQHGNPTTLQMISTSPQGLEEVSTQSAQWSQHRPKAWSINSECSMISTSPQSLEYQLRVLNDLNITPKLGVSTQSAQWSQHRPKAWSINSECSMISTSPQSLEYQLRVLNDLNIAPKLGVSTQSAQWSQHHPKAWSINSECSMISTSPQSLEYQLRVLNDLHIAPKLGVSTRSAQWSQHRPKAWSINSECSMISTSPQSLEYQLRVLNDLNIAPKLGVSTQSAQWSQHRPKAWSINSSARRACFTSMARLGSKHLLLGVKLDFWNLKYKISNHGNKYWLNFIHIFNKQYY